MSLPAVGQQHQLSSALEYSLCPNAIYPEYETTATQGRNINPSAKLLVVSGTEGCQLWGEGQHCCSSISWGGGAGGGGLVASQQPPCSPAAARTHSPMPCRHSPLHPTLHPSAAPNQWCCPAFKQGYALQSCWLCVF